MGRVFRFGRPAAAAMVGLLVSFQGFARSDTSSSKGAPGKESVRWRSIAEGAAESKQSGKPVLYFFTAEWCGPCHLLEKQVFALPEVSAQVERDFVPVAVEDRMRETGRNSPEMLALADRYGLEGFPTLVVSRPGLTVNVALVGWDGRQKAFEFLRTAKKRFLDVEKRPR